MCQAQATPNPGLGGWPKCTVCSCLQSTAFATKTRVSRVSRRAVVVRADQKENTQIEKVRGWLCEGHDVVDMVHMGASTVPCIGRML